MYLWKGELDEAKLELSHHNKQFRAGQNRDVRFLVVCETPGELVFPPPETRLWFFLCYIFILITLLDGFMEGEQKASLRTVPVPIPPSKLLPPHRADPIPFLFLKSKHV